jgi:hypothetical protein
VFIYLFIFIIIYILMTVIFHCLKLIKIQNEILVFCLIWFVQSGVSLLTQLDHNSTHYSHKK